MGSINLGSNGTIANLAVGGLPDGTVDADSITNSTIAKTELNAGVNKVLAKAWCSYNCSTNAIRGHENISSVTDNATGDFTFNFSSDLADVNYAVTASAIGSSNGDQMLVSSVAGNSSTYKQVGNFRCQVRYAGGSNALTDVTDINVAVFQ